MTTLEAETPLLVLPKRVDGTLDVDAIIDRGWDIAPLTIGKVWAINPDWDGVDPATKYELPEITLGWQILKWVPENLVMPDEVDSFGLPKPFSPTAEQTRFLLWWYALHEDGSFLYRAGVLQRLKGWGKDPIVALISAVELVGPCRLAGWATEDMPHLGLERGDPIGRENPTAWIDVAAVSKEQTKNTVSLFPGLFNDACRKRHHMTRASFGQGQVLCHGGQRKIRAVTSNPAALEGGRPTFVVKNETHHWRAYNRGLEMAKVLERNATKSKGGAARTLSITNAYNPAEGSHAQIQREAWEREQSGEAYATGVMYESLEVPKQWGLLPPELDTKTLDRNGIGAIDPDDEERLVRAYLRACLQIAAGDAYWLDIRSLTNSILSGETDVATSKRFWFNQIEAPEDVWIEPECIAAAVDPLAKVQRERSDDKLRAGWDLVQAHEPIVLFGDGSKSDDATAIVGCRLSDGYCFTVGVWQRPAQLDRRLPWNVNRAEVTLRVDEVVDRFNVVAFWFDPSHATDDTDETAFWDVPLDDWHVRHGTKFDDAFWAVPTGRRLHAISWDMASHERQKTFVEGAQRTREELRNGMEEEGGTPRPLFAHDGFPALVSHLRNCFRNPVILHGGFTGVSVRKAGRESLNKIDLAVCLIGARMLRQIVLNVGRDIPEPGAVPKTGMVWAD